MVFPFLTCPLSRIDATWEKKTPSKSHLTYGTGIHLKSVARQTTNVFFQWLTYRVVGYVCIEFRGGVVRSHG